jgi:undecaprenyl-diphosphatase
MTPWLAHLDGRDRALFTRFALPASCPLRQRRFWLGITHAGGARASIGACVASVLLPPVTVATAWRALLLLGVSHAVVQVVKRLAGRPRPSARFSFEALIDVPDRFSFPSGHACAAMAVALGFGLAFPSLAIPLVGLAWLIGVSRVVLGVHYPGDVLVGQAIAVLTALPFFA